MKQLALDFASSPQPTLDNFIAGRNGELLQHLKRLAARQAQERFLYLWGRPGSGRSHLLKGTVAQLQRARAAAVHIACTAGTRLADGLERMDCVALDDVDRLDDEGQVAAFDLYNALRERNGALVAGGAAPPVQLRLREDLVTRLAWGLVYQVHALTDEEKARALADYATGRGFRLLPEVCEYLLTRARRDLPSLLATLDALDRYSLETKRPVTVPLARELLHAADRRGGASGIRNSGARAGD
ncbi:MAG: DnaA regulatory inactivator Hda [Betaproteobacteria bacterium]|nr:DnaA regulatory inactivator Hda [Betaproteobacteria bacterium]